MQLITDSCGPKVALRSDRKVLKHITKALSLSRHETPLDLGNPFPSAPKLKVDETGLIELDGVDDHCRREPKRPLVPNSV